MSCGKRGLLIAEESGAERMELHQSALECIASAQSSMVAQAFSGDRSSNGGPAEQQQMVEQPEQDRRCEAVCRLAGRGAYSC